MPIFPMFHGLVAFEPVALFLCLVTFFRAGLFTKYPAARNYLIFRLFASLYLLLVLNAHILFPIGDRAGSFWYFYSYWACYLIEAGLIFNIVREGFTYAIRQTPMLLRTGDVVLRWVSYLGIFICGMYVISAMIVPHATFSEELVHVAEHLTAAVLIAEVAAISFLAVTAKNFGGKFKSPVTAILMGVGLESAMQWILCSFQLYYGRGLWNIENYILQIITDAIMIGWTLYFPFAKLASDATESEYRTLVEVPLMRWNTVASKFAQRSPMVAKKIDTNFFLQGIARATGTEPATRVH